MKTNFSYMICQIKGTSNNYQLIHLIICQIKRDKTFHSNSVVIFSKKDLSIATIKKEVFGLQIYEMT